MRGSLFCYNDGVGQTLHSLEELQAEAARFAAGLSPHPDHATLVTLSGELGAGKTSFTQGIARALGVGESVTSPTFVLEKVYELEGQQYRRLVHIDAYRLEGAAALAPLGFDTLYADPANLIVLEWPERVEDALPAVAARVSFSVVPEGRTISYA